MAGGYCESDYEQAVIALFRDELKYNYVYGPSVERDYQSPLYEEAFIPALRRINKALPDEAISEAARSVLRLEAGSLLQNNIRFMDFLQNGVEVKFFKEGEERSAIVYLADFSNAENNDFAIANQWAFSEKSLIRADIILFVNGLPLAVIELKSPSREETDASDAYRQLRAYMQEAPTLFAYNAICVMSDMATSKAGTITSSEDRFMEWKTRDGSYAGTAGARFDVFFEGLFEKKRFLDILKNFICFSMAGPDTFKILAGYHQYFAVRKAVASAARARERDGKGGVFWHTQGSGKSLSMVFFARLVREAIENPTIIVITDRNDLDSQLFGQFSRCAGFLRQAPLQAESRKHLAELLRGRQANGIIFTTMQKFEEADSPLSRRSNIVVIADEAHRSHYGLQERVALKMSEGGELEARTVTGTARLIRDALPNAVYIGFTGTPISSKDRSTREVFGDYIDIYDMTQAVEDGATRPVYYESRVMRLKLNEETLKLIDAEYARLEEETEPYIIEKSKKELGRLEAVLGADETIASLVEDIIFHYESYRAHLLTGKAMVVAFSRSIAVKIYRQMLKMRPEWSGKVAVVMTGAKSDPEDWRALAGNKAERAALAAKFKDNASPLKIAIVVDMWLTGFDVPSLATMYVYKPMAGHNLMQAIARVNRVFKDKEGGLVVDYVGIASALKQAMKDYTARDKKNYGEADIAKTAYKKFLEKLAVCRDIFFGYDYAAFMRGDDLARARAIAGGADFILAKKPGRAAEKESPSSVYIREALLLKKALSLCASVAKEAERVEAAFMEAVRIMLVRLGGGEGGKRLSLVEINERISELLKQSIKSEGVINLFEGAGAGQFSLFDPDFLKEIAKIKEKNLALELLKKLLEEQVSVYKKTNVVRAQAFSEILQGAINRYINGMISNQEVIDELLKLARAIAEADAEGERLGLTAEEAAFYDALARPEAVKDFYEHEELIAMTKELTELLRKSRTIDWQKKESARAGMRRLVKRLLKRHRYPPEGMEWAIKTVIEQCELWTDSELRT